MSVQKQKFPNMYPEVFSSLGFRRQLTPKQKRNLRSRKKARRRSRKRVAFSDQTTVHKVPNGQQEDRYGHWVADGIRERHLHSTPSQVIYNQPRHSQLEGSLEAVEL